MNLFFLFLFSFIHLHLFSYTSSSVSVSFFQTLQPELTGREFSNTVDLLDVYSKISHTWIFLSGCLMDDVWGAEIHHSLRFKQHPNWKMLVGGFIQTCLESLSCLGGNDNSQFDDAHLV